MCAPFVNFPLHVLQAKLSLLSYIVNRNHWLKNYKFILQITFKRVKSIFQKKKKKIKRNSIVLRRFFLVYIDLKWRAVCHKSFANCSLFLRIKVNALQTKWTIVDTSHDYISFDLLAVFFLSLLLFCFCFFFTA